MKKSIGMIAIVCLAVFIGCGDKKKSNPSGPGVVHNGTIHATVSGDYNLTFNCTTAYCVASKGTNGSMDVQGFVTSGSDTLSITINILSEPSTGTWALDFLSGNWGAIEKDNTMNISESGSVTVTQATTSKVVGTFNFEAWRMEAGGTGVVRKTVNVSNGTFDVPIILTN
jgi:hypothetical protein